jgi:hypothetical protein
MTLMIFLDMDNCLTNFSQTVKNLGPGPAKGLADDASDEDKQLMYDAIEKSGEPFWSTMSWSSEGRALWDLFKPYNPTLLSSPGKFEFAKSGKLQWVKNNIPGTSLYFSDSKSEYVDPYSTSILIDDSKNNISAWEECGGIGILHQSYDNTERQFLELLWNNPPDINPIQKHW